MVKMKNVSFQYDNENKHAGIYDINLNIKKGEVVLLCGESGCGKTTLTRLINGLIPHYFDGELTGEVLVKGEAITKMPLYETAKYVGSVFQNPRSQFFNVDTNSELAFACENQGLSVAKINQRIATTIKQLKLAKLMGRSIFKLSGGEKQKIACGCVHTAAPEVIVLDEPSSNLDVRGTSDLLKTIIRWKTSGKTIIVAEHRLHYLKDVVNRMIFMKDGRIVKEFVMGAGNGIDKDELYALGLRPFSYAGLLADNKYGGLVTNNQRKITTEAIQIANFNFCYQSGLNALNVDSLQIPKGEIIAIIGENGAGKSTFARCLCGLPKKFAGSVTIAGKSYQKKKLLQVAYMVMQDVNHQIFTESVLDEIMLSMKVADEQVADKILAKLNLANIKERHPMSLSGGQKQRVAIGSAVASKRELIIFDEPTSGLDLKHMKQVSKLLKELKAMGKTIIIISHDLELIMRTCDYVLHMENGQVVDNYALRENQQRVLMFFEADSN
jgi:ATPase components of various ABC-type transport systems, contain duplicated ATPase